MLVMLIIKLLTIRIYISKKGLSFIGFQNFSKNEEDIDNYCIHVPVQSSVLIAGTCKDKEFMKFSPLEFLEKYKV